MVAGHSRDGGGDGEEKVDLRHSKGKNDGL